MNAMPSKLHSGSTFVCMYVCKSILHAKLVRFFRLLDRWHSFVRSVDALGGDQKRKAANTHLCTHLLASCLLFFRPRIQILRHAFSHFSVGDIRVKATSSSSALATTRRCTQGCAAVIIVPRSSGFQRGGLAGRKSGSDGMIRDCGVRGTGSDVWA